MPRVSRLTTAFLLALVLTESSLAVPLGYVSGNNYLEFSEQERTVWFMGFMDGLMAEDFHSKPQVTFKDDANLDMRGEDYWLDRLWTSRCAARHPITQLKAVFEKELNDRPDTWHAPASFIARGKIYEMCKKK